MKDNFRLTTGIESLPRRRTSITVEIHPNLIRQEFLP